MEISTETPCDHEFDFCPELQEMITAQRASGRTGKTFADLGSLSTRNNLITLRNLCLNFRPARTLEVGLGFGASCLVITASHRDLRRNGLGQHMAIDPYQKVVWDDCGLAAAERAGLSGYLDFRETKSSQELAKLAADGWQVELAYIDGSHLFEDVFVDFYFVSKLVGEGGIVLFDDSSSPHVRKLLRFIETNLKQNFVPFALASYRADRGRSLKYRLAGLLRRRQLRGFQRVGPVERPWNARFSNF